MRFFISKLHKKGGMCKPCMNINKEIETCDMKKFINNLIIIIINGKLTSRDVPICNILAICREVLNHENREVLHLGKYFISRFVAIFYKMEASKKIKYFKLKNSRQ